MTLLELLHLLRRHLRLVIILPIVCALAAGTYGYLLKEDVYTASTSMYVLAKSDGVPSKSRFRSFAWITPAPLLVR